MEMLQNTAILTRGIMISLINVYLFGPAAKQLRRRAAALGFLGAALFILFISAAPARAAVGFADYSGGKEVVPLAPYMEYFVDESGELDIEGIFTRENQSRFAPLADGLPLNLRGTLWLRFTLAPVQPGLEPPFLRLDLGRGVPAGSELYLPEGNLDAALSTWIPQPPLEKNIFLLRFSTFSQQAQVPVTAYVKIPGTVGLWFSPQLLTTPTTSLKEMSGVSILDMLAAFWSWLLSPSSSLVYIVLGLLTAWCLSRAFKRGGEWRLWTAVFSALALLQGMVPMPYSPSGKIPLQALLNVVIPGMCFILLIHVGRHLLHSKARKPGLDAALVALSFLGVLLPIIPLLPGFSGFLRLMPLWPFLGILPALACLSAALNKLPGAKRYVLSCLVLTCGGALAWSAAGQAAPFAALVQAPLWAVAAFVFLVGITRVREWSPQALDAGPGEGAEVLRIDDLVVDGTVDDLLPLSTREETASADHFESGEALTPQEPAFAEPQPQGEAAVVASEFLSMAGAHPPTESGAYLKLVPKLAAAPVPERMPELSFTPLGTAEKESPLPAAPASDEGVIELKDIVRNDELSRKFEDAGLAEISAPPAPELESVSEPPESLSAAAKAPRETDKTLPAVGGVPSEAQRLAVDSRHIQPVLEKTPVAAAASSSVSEPRPVLPRVQDAPEVPGVSAASEEPEGRGFSGPGNVSPVSARLRENEPGAAVVVEKAPEGAEETELPWRRHLGGARKGIDMVGDLIKGSSDAWMSEAKEPVLIGPDLLSGQKKAAEWSDLAGELVKGEAAPSSLFVDSSKESGAASPVETTGPAPVASAAETDAPAPTGALGEGIAFNDLVDETAHADALWVGEGAAEERAAQAAGMEEALFSGVDAWKLSDMGRHGQAPREAPAYERQGLEQALPERGEPEQTDEEKAAQAVAQDVPFVAEEPAAHVRPAGGANGQGAREVIFDLQLVLSDAHDAVRGEAERKNLALSWFMPPHLPLLYSGDPATLQEVLQKLLESAVAATDKGTVQLAVRRVPDSTDPGHLIFSVTDSGGGEGAARRNPIALEKAWTLAAGMGGGLNVESAPGQGATVAFTMRLKRPADELYGNASGLEGDASMLLLHSGGTESLSIISRRENHILVVDEQATNRQLIAFFLGNLPYRVVEAKSLEEAMSIYAQCPTGLVIFDSRLEGLDMAEAVRGLHNVDSSLKLSPVPVVALIQDHDELAAMLSAGCKGTLRKPLSRKRVRDLMQALLPGEEELEPGDDFEAQASRPLTTPVKDSPEDYVSHLEFGPVAGDAETAEAGVPFGKIVSVSPLVAEKTFRTEEPEPEAESPAAAKPVAKPSASASVDLTLGSEDNAEELNPAANEVKSFDRVRLDRAKVAGVAAKGRDRDDSPMPWKDADAPAESDSVGIGKNSWLSSFLDAAGKMAGVMGQQERPAEKVEERRGAPVSFDTQSLTNAGPEYAERALRVLEDLDRALFAAKKGLAEENSLAVSQACLRFAAAASDNHLENLERIALCVERAAQANDLEAVKDLLEELESSTARNRNRTEEVLHSREI